MFEEITLSDYIENFIEHPEQSFGAFTRLALALDKGMVQGFPEDFQEFIRHIALSIKPVSPVLVCGADRDEAASRVKPLIEFCSKDPDFPPITYGWKKREEVRRCVDTCEGEDNCADEEHSEEEEEHVSGGENSVNEEHFCAEKEEHVSSGENSVNEEHFCAEKEEHVSGGENSVNEEHFCAEKEEHVSSGKNSVNEEHFCAEKEEHVSSGKNSVSVEEDLKKDETDVFVCPYRHDPLQLLPVKSRKSLLSEAARKTESAYPFGLESGERCPWCKKLYHQSLARAEGVWQKFSEEIVLCREREIPEDGCAAERFVAMNRGAYLYSLDNKNGLPEILNAVRGGDLWPSVFGLVLIPVAEKELAAWEKREKTAKVLEDYWILRQS